MQISVLASNYSNGCNKDVIIPPLNEVEGGILVSSCPSVRLSVCPSVDRIVSALYLQQYPSDPFYIYTSYLAASEGVSSVKFISNFILWHNELTGVIRSNKTPCLIQIFC